MSAIVAGSGGKTKIVNKTSGGASSEGNYTINYTCPKAGYYLLVVAGTGTNTDTINTATCTDGTVTGYDVLSGTRDQSKALTKAFIVKANVAGAQISCSTRFQGYSTNKYRIFALE